MTGADRDQRVLIFPARSPGGLGDGALHFLFSMTQVSDIVREPAVHPVPRTPAHIIGMSVWRDRVMPVISPERCLGLPPGPAADSTDRLVALRTPVTEDGRTRTEGGMVLAGSPLQMIAPPSATPVPAADWPAVDGRYLLGLYRWAEGYLAVIHLARILAGES